MNCSQAHVTRAEQE